MANDYADFDRYCDEHGIKPGEEGPAFAAWLNEQSGWDGPMRQTKCACGMRTDERPHPNCTTPDVHRTDGMKVHQVWVWLQDQGWTIKGTGATDG